MSGSQAERSPRGAEMSCPHLWHIRKQAKNHDVGQCQLCGDSKDFTLIQRKDPGWRKVMGKKPGTTASRVLIQGKRLAR